MAGCLASKRLMASRKAWKMARQMSSAVHSALCSAGMMAPLKVAPKAHLMAAKKAGLIRSATH